MNCRIAALVLSGVLALGVVGCGQQPAEKKTEEVVEGKAEQVVATVEWKATADAAAAAKYAGFEKYGVPKSITIGNNTFKDPEFAYADGVAQAKYEAGAAQLIIRKGAGKYTAPHTDRDKTEFATKWTKNYEGLDVTLYGASQDAATVMTWTDGTADYGVTYQGLGGDELSMNDTESAALVKAVKEANAQDQGEGQQSSQQQSSQQQSSQQQSSQQQSSQQQGSQQSSSSGFSKDACTANALASVGAGDSATNVTTSDLITGGGIEYYLVEFDLDGTHFRVQVDALDGTIVDVIESVNGVAINYDDDGNVINTTELD